VPEVVAIAAEPIAPVAASLQAPALDSAAPPAAPAAERVDTPLPNSLPDYLNQIERDIIVRALTQTHFNRTQAAALLGIGVRQLRYQMQKLNINAPEP
jgi:two-component system response regulator PilR (NtrC family)